MSVGLSTRYYAQCVYKINESKMTL